MNFSVIAKNLMLFSLILGHIAYPMDSGSASTPARPIQSPDAQLRDLANNAQLVAERDIWTQSVNQRSIRIQNLATFLPQILNNRPTDRYAPSYDVARIISDYAGEYPGPFVPQFVRGPRTPLELAQVYNEFNVPGHRESFIIARPLPIAVEGGQIINTVDRLAQTGRFNSPLPETARARIGRNAHNYIQILLPDARYSVRQIARLGPLFEPHPDIYLLFSHLSSFKEHFQKRSENIYKFLKFIASLSSMSLILSGKTPHNKFGHLYDNENLRYALWKLLGKMHPSPVVAYVIYELMYSNYLHLEKTLKLCNQELNHWIIDYFNEVKNIVLSSLHVLQPFARQTREAVGLDLHDRLPTLPIQHDTTSGTDIRASQDTKNNRKNRRSNLHNNNPATAAAAVAAQASQDSIISNAIASNELSEPIFVPAHIAPEPRVASHTGPRLLLVGLTNRGTITTDPATIAIPVETTASSSSDSQPVTAATASAANPGTAPNVRASAISPARTFREHTERINSHKRNKKTDISTLPLTDEQRTELAQRLARHVDQFQIYLGMNNQNYDRVFQQSQIFNLANRIANILIAMGIQSDNVQAFLDEVRARTDHVPHSSDSGQRYPRHYVDISRSAFIQYGIFLSEFEPKTPEDFQAYDVYLKRMMRKVAVP